MQQNNTNVFTVLLVLPWAPTHQGGVTGVVLRLQEHLPAVAIAPILVAADWAHPREQRRENAIHFRFSPQPQLSVASVLKSAAVAPASLWRTYAFLARHRVQAVNFHYPGTAPMAIALLKRLGLFKGRLVLSYHGTDVKPARNRLDDKLRRFMLSAADAVVACSPSLADRMAETFGIDRRKVLEVGNGADSRVFHPHAPRPEHFGHALPESYVLSVGSFIERKDHRTTIEAFEKMATSNSGLALVIAGAMGECYVELLALIDSKDLSSRVHLLPNLDQHSVAYLLANCAMCVQASLAESQPLAVLEAGAAGAPIIASDIPGHRELVRDDVTGLRFAPGDVDGCARAMTYMLSQTAAARDMATNFNALVTTQFTWQRCASKYAALYGAAT